MYSYTIVFVQLFRQQGYHNVYKYTTKWKTRLCVLTIWVIKEVQSLLGMSNSYRRLLFSNMYALISMILMIVMLALEQFIYIGRM